MNIDEMTRKEFEVLPFRKKWNEPVDCDCLIILPTRRKHDGDYRCMDFVAVKNNEPICRLSGGSGVMYFNGIGGYGWNWANLYAHSPDLLPRVEWYINCLFKSGLLCLRAKDHFIRCASAVSSFEFYAIESEEK